jgi:hypothetical protein
MRAQALNYDVFIQRQGLQQAAELVQRELTSEVEALTEQEQAQAQADNVAEATATAQ